MEVRLALPQRSPSLLSVPWIWRAPAHRGERVRHRLLGVVMGMDADVVAGDHLDHFADDGLTSCGKGAIGVADTTQRASRRRPPGAGQCKFRVGFVAVEEMLAVEQTRGLCPGGARTLSRIEARFSSPCTRAQRARDSPRTWRRSRWRRPWLEQRRGRVVRGRAVGPLVTPKAVKWCRPCCWKTARVGRVGTGVAALDIVNAEIVEHVGDDELVVQREVDAVGLRAVTQRGVEEIKAFAGQGITKDNN